MIADRRVARLECTGQATGIDSRRACQWAVLIAGDPARADDPASAHQAVRTRPLLPALNRSWSCDVSSLRCLFSARLGLRRRPGSRPANARVRDDRLLGGRLRRILGAGLDSFLGPSSLAFCLSLGGDALRGGEVG
jgi:hypothetical protein